MEQNVGRSRLGRESRAHASARAANPTRSKRGRRRQSPVPFQGRHDDEAGASGAVSSQQDEVEAEAPEVEATEVEAPEVGDDGDDDDVVYPPPEGGYGGGPTDLTVLYTYHKHRANRIWAATNFEDKVYTN